MLGALVVFAFSVFPGSATGEELGWRGFALPQLQATRTALQASLVVGLGWGLWHLPLWLTGSDSHPIELFPAFVVSAMAMSVILTWMYNGTDGSLFVIVVYHAAANLPITLLLAPLGRSIIQPFLIYAGLLAVTATAITLRTAPGILGLRPSNGRSTGNPAGGLNRSGRWGADHDNPIDKVGDTGSLW